MRKKFTEKDIERKLEKERKKERKKEAVNLKIKREMGYKELSKRKNNE